MSNTKPQTILITGATAGIGRLTAAKLVAQGHHVLLHGRSAPKLASLRSELAAPDRPGRLGVYVADLSRLTEVRALAEAVAADHATLDVLINNAGVYNAAEVTTPDGLDVRFVVNTIAPYLLTQQLLPRLGPGGRVVNLSSAAQAPVDLEALAGRRQLGDHAAYAQSKLAITAWSRTLAASLGDDGPVIVAVNPGSLLATKMVNDAFGVAGNDVNIGADILLRAALSEEFATASGQYYDNDARRFGPPHAEALDDAKGEAIVEAVEAIVARLG